MMCWEIQAGPLPGGMHLGQTDSQMPLLLPVTDVLPWGRDYL